MKKLKAVFWFIVFLVLGLVQSLLSPAIRVVAMFVAFLSKGRLKLWGINVWEGVDNAVSAEFGGDPDESISSRLGKAKLRGSGWGLVADKVDLVASEIFNDPNHCYNSIERDEGRKQITTY